MFNASVVRFSLMDSSRCSYFIIGSLNINRVGILPHVVLYICFMEVYRHFESSIRNPFLDYSPSLSNIIILADIKVGG